MSDDTEIIVTLKLTREQIDLLSEAVHGYQDEGPPPERWASNELKRLREIVSKAAWEGKDEWLKSYSNH